MPARSGCSSRSRSPSTRSQRLGVGRPVSSTPCATSRRWTRCLSSPSSVDAGGGRQGDDAHAASIAATRAVGCRLAHAHAPRRGPREHGGRRRWRPGPAARAVEWAARRRRPPGRSCPCTGIRASTGRSSTSPISFAPERPARLVEQHDARGVLERRGVDGPAEREVAAAQHDDRDVGHLDHRPRRGLARGAAVDEHRRRAERRARPRARRRSRLPGSAVAIRGPTPTRQERDAGRDLDEQAVERLGGRLGARRRASRPGRRRDRRRDRRPRAGRRRDRRRARRTPWPASRA